MKEVKGKGTWKFAMTPMNDIQRYTMYAFCKSLRGIPAIVIEISTDTNAIGTVIEIVFMQGMEWTINSSFY